MYVIVTRYVRPDGRIIVHAYGGPCGGYDTRNQAVAAHKRHLADLANHGHPGEAERAEMRVVKVLAL